MEVIIWKENKEVGTICFEIRIPMKKTKIFLEFFYVSFRKKISIFGFSNSIMEENKNIYGNTFIPWKSHWNIGLLRIGQRYNSLTFKNENFKLNHDLTLNQFSYFFKGHFKGSPKKLLDLFDIDSVTLFQISSCYAKFMYEALEIFNQEHNLIK